MAAAGRRERKRVDLYDPSPAKKSGDASSILQQRQSSGSDTELNEDPGRRMFFPTAKADLAPFDFGNLMGLDRYVSLLRGLYVAPLKYPEAFKSTPSESLFPNCFFYGPAGTGKTDMILSLAKEMGVMLFRISASQIQSSFQAASKKNFYKLLDDIAVHTGSQERLLVSREQARMEVEAKWNAERTPQQLRDYAGARCIVFFDEADTLLGEASFGGKSDTSIINVFKELVNVGTEAKRRPRNVVWFGATNSPEAIVDVGILSRFPRKLYVGLPFMIGKCYRLELMFDMFAGSLQICCVNDRDLLENTLRGFDIESYISGGANKAEREERAREIRDMERLCFFYTPREMGAIMAEASSRAQPSALSIFDYAYWQRPDGCVDAYPQDAAERERTAERNRLNGQPVPPAGAKLLGIDQLTPEQQGAIRWRIPDILSLQRALMRRVTFSSLTWSSLVNFYDYAKNVMYDTTGLKEILTMIWIGATPRVNPLNKLISKRFANSSSLLPSFPVDEPRYAQILADLRDPNLNVAVSSGISCSDEWLPASERQNLSEAKEPTYEEDVAKDKKKKK